MAQSSFNDERKNETERMLYHLVIRQNQDLG